MKKITIVLAILLSIPVLAQEKPLVASAVIAFRDNDIAEAKRYIDEASAVISKKSEGEINTKVMSKFLYHKGLIYFYIHNSEDEGLKAQNPDALDIAAENFEKLIDFENRSGKKQFTNDVKSQLPYIAAAYANRGIARNSNQDYQGAYEDFMTTYELKQKPPTNEIDTAMLYNAAIMAQNAKNIDKAIELNRKLVDMNFMSREYKATDAESGDPVLFGNKKELELAVKAGSVKDPLIEGDIRSDLYVILAGLYLSKGDTASFIRYVKEGRSKYPDNAALLRSELQLFLDAKEYDKAMANLNQAIEAEPKNKLYYYIKGYIMQTEMDSIEPAKKAYDKAIALDSSYVEALYMRGLIHVNRANEITQEMNKLKLNEKSKYDKLEKEQKEEFRASLPYFKRVYKVNPKDTDNLNALKEVYYKLKMYEDAQRINEELAAVQG